MNKRLISDILEEADKQEIQNQVDQEAGGLTKEDTSTGFVTSPQDKIVSNIWRQLSLSDKRVKKYDLVEKMYDIDEICSSQIDNIASASTTNGISVKVKGAKKEEEPDILESKAQTIINDMIKRLKLNKGSNSCQMVAKRGILFGDDFYEPIVDLNTMDIVDWKERPRHMMKRVEDNDGNLQEYEQYDNIVNQNDPIASFEPWQIIHFKWNKIKGMYGRSILMSQRSTFKKLQMMEKDMVVRRRTRAGQKLHHKPNLEATKGKPLTGKQIKEHMKLNSTKKHTVRTNFYSNGLWDIESIQGDNTLDKIEDILYFQEKQFIGGKVPKGLLASGQDINRAVLERQDIGYSRILADVNEMLEEGYEQLINLQLIIKDIDYDEIEYEFVWGDNNNDDKLKKIELAIKMFDKAPQASIPVQYVVEELFDISWAEAKKQHKEYAEHLSDIMEIQKDAMDVYMKNNVSNRGVDPKQMKGKANEEIQKELWDH